METFARGGVTFAWDAARRRLFNEFVEGHSANEDDARALISWLHEHAGDGPLEIVVDARGGAAATTGYRLAWANHLRGRTGPVRMAVYHAEKLDALTVPIFAKVAGIDARTFRTRADAEAWLDER